MSVFMFACSAVFVPPWAADGVHGVARRNRLLRTQFVLFTSFLGAIIVNHSNHYMRDPELPTPIAETNEPQLKDAVEIGTTLVIKEQRFSAQKNFDAKIEAILWPT